MIIDEPDFKQNSWQEDAAFDCISPVIAFPV